MLVAVAWIRLLCVATALLYHIADAQRAQWLIVDRSGATTTPWSSDLVERCAFEELRARVEGSVPASFFKTIKQETRASGSEGVRVPLEIVRADDADYGQVVLTTSMPLRVQLFEDEDNNESLPNTKSSPIECAFDTLFCTPKIVGIRLPDLVVEGQTLQANHSIVLQFADATNQPPASTKEEIDAFVAFSAYIGDELEGKWQDEKTLVVVVMSMDTSLVLPQQELMSALVHTTVRPSETSTGIRDSLIRFHGEIRLRVEPLGWFAIRSRLKDDVFLGSPQFHVRSCADASDLTATVVVLADDTIAAALQGTPNESTPPQPTFRIDGVLSHSGSEGFTLDHKHIKVRDPGSWSFNFWLFTNQDATGNFRTLFFNGDGLGQHRTPSAWFRPNDRRLVLRVSTITNMDIGLDSVQEIPLNEWVNLGVNVRNCSTSFDVNSTVREECTSGDDKPFFYSMRLFVNGVLDQDVRIFAPVLPNDGPFHLAKGPWTDGIRGFTSHFQVFDHDIRDVAHKEIYNQGRRALYRPYLASECDAVFHSHSIPSLREVPLHPVRQILHWTQCLAKTPIGDNDQFGLPEAVATGHKAAEPLYSDSVLLTEKCKTTGWDVLVEAAELGDSRALHDTGKAFVYGLHAFPETCASSRFDGVRVKMDHSKAKLVLERSLQMGYWNAARHLALLYTINPPASPPMLAGLYHLAAAAGRRDAFMALGRIYSTGETVQEAETVVAGYHYLHAASAASAAFHSRGKEPHHEMNRLYDGVDKEDELHKGQLGDDDELIQYQKMRADKDGDVDAMAHMGDLYYWGARGVARDHDQAYSYFRRAAERDHASAQAAVAGMLLKGERTKQDNASAINWYEKAALKNHTRALNGLGFVYFHGSGGKTENKTLALEFFERAAANMEDGDSVFNAGYCYANGLGTKPNITRAIQYYELSARKFGHFDAIHELGKIYWNGGKDSDGGCIIRDSSLAVPYLRAASEAGPWGASIRAGFELFLVGDFERAAVRYHEASEYGYPIATSNLAYLYDQKLLRSGDPQSESRAFDYLRRACDRTGDKEVLLRIGDHHFYGLGGLTASPVNAMRWYSRASAEGVEAGAYNVGHMHEYGLGVPVNYERAERYYKRVLELAPPGALDRQIAVQLALFRLQLRGVFDGSPFASYLSNPAPLSPILPGSDIRQSISGSVSIIVAIVAMALGVCAFKWRGL